MERAKEYWILSYLFNWINMMDLAKLQRKDMHPTYISYIRKKTKITTKGNPITITIPRNNFIDRIINERRIDTLNPEEYVFGIISKSDQSKREERKLSSLLILKMIG